MQPIKNYENIQPSDGSFDRPGPGGYICRIVNVTDNPLNPNTGKGDYLKIEYDIHEGTYKDYFSDSYKRTGKWYGNFIRSYKESAHGMFKHFTDCVEASNSRYQWNFDESTLNGKMIGLVFGEEEYLKNNGDVGTRMYVYAVKTVDQIDKGDYKVPALKTLSGASAPVTQAFTQANFPVMDDDDGELPF